MGLGAAGAGRQQAGERRGSGRCQHGERVGPSVEPQHSLHTLRSLGDGLQNRLAVSKQSRRRGCFYRGFSHYE